MSLTQTVLRSSTLAALTSPHGVDRYLELVNPMWAAHEVRARIVRTWRETSEGAPVTTLTLQPTGTWDGFTAGQHVQLGVEVDGARRTTRAFSISSASSGPGEPFTITMRANPDGVVSRWLTSRDRVGTVVHLSQAEGEFVLPEVVPDRLLLVSGGSGITPVMSMLRTLLRQGHTGQVTFLHYSQSPRHQIFAGELAMLGLTHENLDLHVVHPEQDAGYLTAETLAGLVPDFATTDTWACGPPGMIEVLREAYAAHGEEAAARLRVEFFKTPMLTAGTAEGEVSFTTAGGGVETGANSGQTLLEQAEALGLAPEFGCRMGICFTCTSRKTEGTVRHVVTGVESSLPDEDIQICVSQPVGDCAVTI